MKLILSRDSSLYSLPLDRTQPQITTFTFEAQPLSPPRPSGDDASTFLARFGPRVVGSCMGLLALNYTDCCTIWNPSTGTHQRIPEPEVDEEFVKREKWNRYVVHGLVYDEGRDDYKVVRVYQYLDAPKRVVKKPDKVEKIVGVEKNDGVKKNGVEKIEGGEKNVDGVEKNVDGVEKSDGVEKIVGGEKNAEKIEGVEKNVDGVEKNDEKVEGVEKIDEKVEGVEEYDTKVLVYSLRANAWERVGDFPYVVKFRNLSDVFVNGCLHFEVSSKKRSVDGDVTVASDCMIAAFDVSNHTCRVVSHLVRSRIFQSKFELELGVLGGRLCIIRNYDHGYSQCMIMKEYGVNSSWAELFRIKIDTSKRLNFRPVSYFRGEKLVLLEAGGEIFCLDVESKSFKDFEIEGVSGDFCYYVCMESEVVLGSVDHQVHEDNPKIGDVLDNVVGDDDYNKLQQFAEKVKEENLEKVAAELEVNEENLAQQVNEQNLGNVDGDDCDKKQQVNEDVKEENLVRASAESEVNEETLQQVNELNLGTESVLGNVDGDDCDKMQQVKEENLERVSVESDLGAT